MPTLRVWIYFENSRTGLLEDLLQLMFRGTDGYWFFRNGTL